MAKALLYELGKSASFGRLSILGKVLWPMLLAASDEQGRGLAEPDVLKWSVCPNVAELTLDNISGVLTEMVGQQMIHLYENESHGKLYQVVRWWEYQQLQWAHPSRLIAPEGWIDRVRYTVRGEGTTVDNWDTPGGFCEVIESLPSPDPPDNPPGDSPGNPPGIPADNPPGVPTQLNSTQPNLTELKGTELKGKEGASAPKTSPPSLFPKISDSPEKNAALIALREKHGADPLTGMLKFTQRQEAKLKGRPPGWGSVSADVWAVCDLVAEQFPCTLPRARQSYNASTQEITLQHIDKWSGGATLLLEKFDNDVRRTLDAITAFRRTFDGGFTVAGPQSLLNSVGPGIVSKPASRSKRGYRRPEYEPATDAERADAWARYAPALERYIEERGSDANLDAVMEETATAVGCSIESARALLEARAVRAALAEEPLAVGAEAIGAFFAEG